MVFTKTFGGKEKFASGLRASRGRRLEKKNMSEAERERERGKK